MAPRALLLPPGIPDFHTRARTVVAGEVLLEGRAWSGRGPIAQVDVSTDDGASWAGAQLGPSAGRWAWRSWSYSWLAEPGEYVLCCRARDGAGNVQPLDAPWNVGGYSNNALQRIPVTVQ
jgi:hypothetical protein